MLIVPFHIEDTSMMLVSFFGLVKLGSFKNVPCSLLCNYLIVFTVTTLIRPDSNLSAPVVNIHSLQSQ